MESGDNTGPQSAQLILSDPTVEVAVLETARGGILRSGLGFDQCDVGIVLNVAADHLGIGDIDTVEQLATLKSVLVESVMPKGYAVLNADDPLVARMAQSVKAQIAYFSMNPDNELVARHTAAGGLAAIYENGYLSILKGDWTLRIEQADERATDYGRTGTIYDCQCFSSLFGSFCPRIENRRHSDCFVKFSGISWADSRKDESV